MYATRNPTFSSFFASDMDPFERMECMMRAFEHDMNKAMFEPRIPFQDTRIRAPFPSSRSFRIPVRCNAEEPDVSSEEIEMKKVMDMSLQEHRREQERRQQQLTEDEQMQLALALSKMEEDQSNSEEEEEPLIMHRRLRHEQDKAYEEALKKDQETEKRKEEEMEVQTEQEALELSLKLTRQARHNRALEILEPEPDASDLDSTQIVIRLPNGTRLDRRFCIHDNIEQLRAFVDSKLMELECIPLEYDLVSDFPKKVYNNKQTFLQAGLTPRALVSILPRE